MRPKLKFLDEALIERIVSEALDLLATLGVEVQNGNAAALLGDHGGFEAEHVGYLLDGAGVAAADRHRNGARGHWPAATRRKSAIK